VMSFNRARVSPEVASAAYYLCFGLPVAAFGAKMYSVYAPAERCVGAPRSIDRSTRSAECPRDDASAFPPSAIVRSSPSSSARARIADAPVSHRPLVPPRSDPPPTPPAATK